MAQELDIFNPEISVVAHGLEGKTIMIYGTNNVGKTAQSVRAKKPFVLACESGLNALNGVRYYRINNWREFKKAIDQFTNKKTIDKAKEMYSTIIIDEVYASSLFCQKFVCDTYGEGCVSLGANPNSKVNLYQVYERLYWEQINKLVGAGYTVIFIGHAQEKDGYVSPKGDKRCLGPILDNCDIVAYVVPNGIDENGKVIKSSAYFAQTNQFFARSRYDYMVTHIDEFTIENLEKAIADGIEAQAKAEGVQTVDYAVQQAQNAPTVLSYEELMDELQVYGGKLVGANKADLVTEIVENTLGVGKKVTECTKKQIESIAIVLDDLKSACEELGL